jgi:hypothetical protein
MEALQDPKLKFLPDGGRRLYWVPSKVSYSKLEKSLINFIWGSWRLTRVKGFIKLIGNSTRPHKNLGLGIIKNLFQSTILMCQMGFSHC